MSCSLEIRRMSNAMLDARQEADSYRRIGGIKGRRRRRRWTTEEKVRIVAESFEEGANVSEVARRNGVVRGLLTVWRNKFAAAAGVRNTKTSPQYVLAGSASLTSADSVWTDLRKSAGCAATTPLRSGRSAITDRLFSA